MGGSRAASQGCRTAPQRPPIPVALVFRHGLLTDVLDPEAPLIFLSVLPQCVALDAAVLPRAVLLSGIRLVLAAACPTTLSLVVARLQDVFSRAVVRRRLDRVTGLVLLDLGIRVPLEHRPVPA